MKGIIGGMAGRGSPHDIAGGMALLATASALACAFWSWPFLTAASITAACALVVVCRRFTKF